MRVRTIENHHKRKIKTSAGLTAEVLHHRDLITSFLMSGTLRPLLLKKLTENIEDGKAQSHR